MSDSDTASGELSPTKRGSRTPWHRDGGWNKRLTFWGIALAGLPLVLLLLWGGRGLSREEQRLLGDWVFVAGTGDEGDPITFREDRVAVLAAGPGTWAEYDWWLKNGELRLELREPPGSTPALFDRMVLSLQSIFRGRGCPGALWELDWLPDGTVQVSGTCSVDGAPPLMMHRALPKTAVAVEPAL